MAGTVSPPPAAAVESELVAAVRTGDRDRWLCALFAPPAARADLWTLLAFNLEIARVRDVVSEPGLGEIRLQWWRDAIGEAYAGKPRQHPVAEALATAIGRSRPPLERFERLLHGRTHDLYDDPIPDLAALEAYADATSGELAALSVDVLGVHEDGGAAHRAARAIGVATGLLDVVRDTPRLAARHRCMLPRDLLTAHGVPEQALFEGTPGPGLRDVTAAISARAAALLARARTERAAIPSAALPALLPARLLDRRIARLKAAGHDVYARPADAAPWLAPLTLWWAHARRRF
ncbi:MAG: squalene/phytoene synthase family protein [Rhodospirillales bacterium]|nr:squalene/phytoene synthase family protein [Rhodospirillales bacterium]